MNNAPAIFVPPIHAEILVQVEAASVEQRHKRMITASAEIKEVLLEELSEEGLDQVKSLIGLIGADLAYCRMAILEGETVTT